MRSNHHIDHIDPKWAEGRDYQLVCGLDGRHGPHGVANLCERELALNIRKRNRFLPWRNSRDEIGGDPVEQGDLCLFLDLDTNEWVLEEFLGTWWFEKSRRTDSTVNAPRTAEWRANARAGQIRKAPPSDETRAKLRAAAKRRAPVTDETRAKMSVSQTGREHSRETKAKIGKGNLGLIKSPRSTQVTDEEHEKRSKSAKEFWVRQRAKKHLCRMAKCDPLTPDFDD